MFTRESRVASSRDRIDTDTRPSTELRMARTALFDSDLQDVDYHGTFVRRHCHPQLLGLVAQLVGYSEPLYEISFPPAPPLRKAA